MSLPRSPTAGPRLQILTPAHSLSEEGTPLCFGDLGGYYRNTEGEGQARQLEKIASREAVTGLNLGKLRPAGTWVGF